MKKIFLIFLVLVSFRASAQYDSTRIRQKNSAYGYDYNNLKTLGSNIIPLDTFKLAVKDSGGIAYKSGFVWAWTGYKWVVQAGGVTISTGSGIDSVTYSSNQLCQWVDGVSTCYRLNKFFDSTSYNFDSTKTIFYNNGIAIDSIIGRTPINLHWPFYYDATDSSFRFGSDSLPDVLKYAPGVDTSGTSPMDIPVKKWVLDRLSGGITQSQLNDTAAAIRAYSYPLAGNPSGFLTSASITGKVNTSDTATMLSPYIRTSVANATFATISNLGLKADKATTITINGTTQDLSSNRSWTVVQTDPALTTLTDGATITWDMSTQTREAKVTLAGNRTLSITNLPSGKVIYLTLGVTQDATGTRTLALPAGTKVINGGAGAATLSTTASATDILSFRWNGTTLFCTYGKNYN